MTQVAFKPDWTKHAKAAPFKRNDAMLDVLPVGVLVFPGTGIQENLADKAKKAGYPGHEVREGGVSPLFLSWRKSRWKPEFPSDIVYNETSVDH